MIEAISARTSETLTAISARTEKAASIIGVVENSLAGSVDSLIDRLAESNSALASVVEKATRELSAVDRQLGETGSHFAETATRATEALQTSSRLVDDGIERLSHVAGNTLSQVGGIVGSFENHSKVLGQASDLLAAAQSNLVGTLEERQEALRSLSIGLVKRSEEIENTMRGLGDMVESALERADNRAGQMTGNLRQGIQNAFADIGKVLSHTEQRAQATAETMRSTLLSAGEETTRAVEQTLSLAEKRSGELAGNLRTGLSSSLSDVDRLLTEAGRKSDVTAEHMRQAVRQAVEDAVGRFGGATEEIRRSAHDIRKELDITRAELKRGAFDLPEEAKENAAAMRRAVSEQIRALQDLSQLVGKSTRQFEVSEPAPRAAAPAPAPVVERPVAQRPQPQPQQAAVPARTETMPGLRGTLSPERPTVAAPARPAPREEYPANSGWISDLLRGASRDEAEHAPLAQPQIQRAPEPAPAPRADQRNPRHMVESLNSLSVDIARAIDHDTSVELWRRYQRGERDVFTRRLYTLKGQQTFDEIKRKYEREPEFRSAVDRYIADFEKLLTDVARTDRDRTASQSYLTSDTGKVYTMLAHAAGRLG